MCRANGDYEKKHLTYKCNDKNNLNSCCGLLLSSICACCVVPMRQIRQSHEGKLKLSDDDVGVNNNKGAGKKKKKKRGRQNPSTSREVQI